MNQLEANKAVVRQYVDAFNRGDTEALRRIFAPEATVQRVLGAGGMEKVLAVWQELHAAFANVLTVEQIIAEGDLLAVRYTERGKFRGAFRGAAPTDKTFEVVALEWFVVRGGRIQQRWGARDFAAIARQIGLPLN